MTEKTTSREDGPDKERRWESFYATPQRCRQRYDEAWAIGKDVFEAFRREKALRVAAEKIVEVARNYVNYNNCAEDNECWHDCTEMTWNDLKEAIKSYDQGKGKV